MTVDVEWPPRVEGERASIQRFAQDAQRALDADWLTEAAQAIAGRAAPCHLATRLEDGDQGWWIIGDGRRVGALCGRIVEAQDGVASRTLIWTWLAIDAHWRAYGYGGASVPLLERAARSLGATAALTPLPPDNGVALYFWLRLGYTPQRSVSVQPCDWPIGVPTDALWMQRPLDSIISTDSPGGASDVPGDS